MVLSSKDPGKLLTDVMVQLSMAKTMETITQLVAQASRTLTGADGASFVLRDGEQCYYVDENAIAPLWKGKRFPLEACISGWSMIHRETVAIKDIRLDPRIPQDAYRPTFVRSLCMVPIRREAPIGAIGNYWSEEYVPSDEQIRLLSLLADTTAVAIENLSLKNELQHRAEERTGFQFRHKELETAILTLAHDLKNPIATVSLFSELIKKKSGENLDERSSRYLNSIVTTCERMNSQIQRILSLFQISREKIYKHDIDLSDVAHEIADYFKRIEGGRSITFEIDPAMQAKADPVLIRVVLENLFSNAVKYSQKRDHTVVRFEKVEESPEGIVFAVKDNGAGFDSAQGHRLFQPLSRLHDESEFPGTGLGLASVARVIELHGGSVRAESKPGQGASFYFRLPAG